MVVFGYLVKSIFSYFYSIIFYKSSIFSSPCSCAFLSFCLHPFPVNDASFGRHLCMDQLLFQCISVFTWPDVLLISSFRLCEGGELLDRILSRYLSPCLVCNLIIQSRFFYDLTCLFFSKGWKIFRRWCKGSNGTNPKCCCLLPSSGCSSQRSQTRGNILCHLQFFMFFIIWFCFHWMKCFYGHLMIHSSRKFCYSSFLWFFFQLKKISAKVFHLLR